MNKEHLRELWASYLTGHRLSPSDEKALVEALKSDALFRAEILRDAELDGLLHARGVKDEDVFVQSVLDRVEAESDGTRFVRSIERRIAQEHPTRRREISTSARRGSPFWVGLAAAGVFVVIVALWMFLRNEGTPSSGGGGQVTHVPPEEIKSPPKETPRPVRHRAPFAVAPRKQLPKPEEKSPTEFVKAPRNPQTPPKANETAKKPEDLKSTEEKKPTVAAKEAVATLEQVQGAVAALNEKGEAAPLEGPALISGSGLKTTGGGSCVVAKFTDGTRFRLGGDSTLKDVFDRQGKGKHLRLSEGVLTAEVTKQSANQPMIIETPQGEAKVMGTSLRIVVHPGSTLLEVREGQVDLKRTSDGKVVQVKTGYLAVIAAGIPFEARRMDASDLVQRMDGLKLWFRADKGITQTGASVSQWEDQSISRAHAVQSSVRGQPILVPEAINGRPALRFDGKDTNLKFPMPLEGAQLTIILVSACSQDRTRDADGSGGYSAVFWHAKDDPASFVLLSSYQSNVEFRFASSSDASPRFQRPASIGESPSITVARKNGVREDLFVNGSLVMAQTSKVGAFRCPSPGILGQGADGPQGDRCFQGDIAEVLVFTKALTDADRARVEEYLLNKYAPTLTRTPLKK